MEGKVWNSAVFRVGVLLFSILVVFFIARQMAVPKSFGEFGYYRGDSLNQWASMNAKYAGASSEFTCESCHQDKAKTLSSGSHTQLNGQVCHGPAQEHTQTPFKVKSEVPVANAALCASCHANVNGRAGLITTVNVAQHAAGLNCGQCHNPHRPLNIIGI